MHVQTLQMTLRLAPWQDFCKLYNP